MRNRAEVRDRGGRAGHGGPNVCCDSSSFGPLGPDPGQADTQLWPLSQESLGEVLGAGRETPAKHRDLEPGLGLLRSCAPRARAGF